MPKKEMHIILNERREMHKRFEGTTSTFQSEFVNPRRARFSKLLQNCLKDEESVN